MLNAMYTQFDQLSEKHEVYKVRVRNVVLRDENYSKLPKTSFPRTNFLLTKLV